MNRIGFPVLCCLFLFFAPKVAIAQNAPNIQKQQAIAETARLYLESNSGYVPGDLITASQIDELQQYLRRSFGNTPATHRGLLNRAIADNAPLSRFFFREQGSQVLRRASEMLGGYAAIEALSLDRQGRQILQKAVTTGSVAELVATVESSRQIPDTETGEILQKASPRQLKTIYTLEDFLAAAFPKNPGKKAP